MDYAKTEQLETIKEHTDSLLENLKILRKIYEREIVKVINIDKKRFWELLEIICKYHDIGKVYIPFQNIIRDKLGKPLIQTKFSYEILKHEQLSPIFIPVEKYKLTKDEKLLVYQVIYYHHERERKEINSQYLEEVIKEDIEPRIKEIKEEFGYEIEEDLDISFIKYIRNRIKERDKLYIEYCLLKGLLHRLDHSSSAGVKIEDDTLENIADFIDVFITNKSSRPNKLQKFSKENKNENLVGIGSTGVGKTESALYWSNGGKTFFTLPLRTSINAMYDRIEDTIGYKHVGLLHSTALEYLEEKEEFENEEEKYNQSKNLCEKITTCTIDQIFPFVFKYKGYEKMLNWVKIQGGDIKSIKIAKNTKVIKSKEEGYIKSINALEIGKLSRKLGAGRLTKDDEIDLTVGIVLNHKVGDYVSKDEPLAAVIYNEKEITEEEFLSCYSFSKEKIEKPKLIIDIIR